MENIVLVTVMSVTVEALVEYGRSILQSFGGKWETAVLQISAVAVSVGLCLLTGADVYAAFDIGFGRIPLGCILTGIFAARGANFISDFVGRLQALLTKH